jgi:Kef-type K+ transport system membrane component KefB
MSGGSSKGAASRLTQGLVLAVLVGLLLASSKLAPGARPGSIVASVGFLALAGTITSSLLEPIKLPHLTGYLLAGMLAGPYILHIVDHETVDELTFINSLALSLIALAGGAELRLDVLRSEMRRLSWAIFIQCLVGVVAMGTIFFLMRPFLPFLGALTTSAVAGVAILWGCIAISRSPSALLGILAQTRASGPLATHSLAFVMLSDVVVVVIFACGLIVARPLIDPSASLSMKELSELGHELLGSITIGTTLGLLLALYLRLVGSQLLLVLLALGFGAWEVIRYLRFDSLLAFLMAGFVVQNFSKQGEKLLHAIETTSGVVFVVFFATAGAHLNLSLLAKLGPVALALCACRALVSWGCARAAARFSDAPPAILAYSWTPLVSQAGLTLGLVVILERQFPAFGTGLRALGVATVAINEMVGPILFKWGIDRAGESSEEPPTTRSSLASKDTP